MSMVVDYEGRTGDG